MSSAVELLHDPERVRLALSPVKRQLLERLREPSSATQLAAELGTSRQRVNYHLRALEQAGLVILVEERQRRGCTERVLVATADAFVVDPSVMHAGDASAPTPVLDRYAAQHLIGTAAGMVRDVARMQAAAQQERTRLLTFTVEAEVGFADPGDIERFATRLAELMEQAASEFNVPGGRRYRVVAGGHPAPQAAVGDPDRETHER
jgi:DNA-binding transcriptional ArsR family regulator